MMIIINLSVYCGFNCLYKYDKKFTKSSIGHIHSLMLAKWRHRETFSKKMKNEIVKGTISSNMKKNIEDLLADLWTRNQERPARLSFWQKGECVTTNEVLARRDGIKRKMVKTGITPSITEDADSEVPRRNALKLTLAQRKGIPS